MGAFSLSHILILLIIILVVTKPARLTELAKALGKTFRGFKESKDEIEAEYTEIDSKKEKQKDKV